MCRTKNDWNFSRIPTTVKVDFFFFFFFKYCILKFSWFGCKSHGFDL